MPLETPAADSAAEREPVLDTVERVCELCFGLFMALTFVGIVSATTTEPEPGKLMFITALGCNLAWGLADGVMYLVRTLTDRGRRLSLALGVRAADAAEGVRKLREELSPAMRTLVADTELEAIRQRLAAVPTLPDRPRFKARDFAAAAMVFAMVVLGTFPVALPFIVFADAKLALLVSRILTLVMLFAAGIALGRHAGYGGWRAGLAMTVTGVLLTAGIIALGG